MIAKANQPQLLQDIQNLFVRADSGPVNPFRPPVVRALSHTPHWNSQSASSVGKAHGRIERRTLRVLELPASLQRLWPHARQVFALERRIESYKSGKSRVEVVMGVTSLERGAAGAQDLLEVVRLHWGIENRSHWVRDVLWDEDQCRTRTGSAPQILATFRNLALALLRRISPQNIAHATRKCAANPMRALQLLRTE
ncbi:hypothetical protein IAD21_04122 [Abditibacteriota bacterium]|nr:hypothetical protein IAD21_02204 [Abditibacteriota bacterium]BCM90594.1 hypothetical protein IAD21_02448 [Abditibacteriota bacterium]BCM92243.1 hypothetical protein IAD21_04122 [Abditibacteriota bacterium]